MSNTDQEKIPVPYPVIVEGKYDRLRLLSVIDAQILTTDGFGIFKKNEKSALFRALAAKTPIIVLTDSDGAGVLIRSYLSRILPPDRIIPLYVPRIPGCERRKSVPSAEGILGVEGQETVLLRHLFAPFSAACTQTPQNPLSKADFHRDGLSGAPGCTERRAALARRFGLPDNMTANALLAALRIVAGYEDYLAAVAELN